VSLIDMLVLVGDIVIFEIALNETQLTLCSYTSLVSKTCLVEKRLIIAHSLGNQRNSSIPRMREIVYINISSHCWIHAHYWIISK